MKRCNETITVFNAKLDTDTDYDVYTGTVIVGVSWFCETASTVDSSGLKAADKFTVRIPTDANFNGKTYVDPIAYAASGNPAKNFTLKSGDIIVKGAVSAVNPRPGDLQKQYAEVLTILGVTDSRSAVLAPHWKVVGK